MAEVIAHMRERVVVPDKASIVLWERPQCDVWNDGWTFRADQFSP